MFLPWTTHHAGEVHLQCTRSNLLILHTVSTLFLHFGFRKYWSLLGNGRHHFDRFYTV